MDTFKISQAPIRAAGILKQPLDQALDVSRYKSIVALLSVLDFQGTTMTVRLITGMQKERFTPANGEATLSGVYIETDDRTGRATRVQPIREGGLLQSSAP